MYYLLPATVPSNVAYGTTDLPILQAAALYVSVHICHLKLSTLRSFKVFIYD